MLALRASLYATVSVAVTMIVLAFGGNEFSPYLASTAAISAAVLVSRSNRARPQSGLITLFFWLAAAHAICGYWAAGSTTLQIWIGSNAGRMFRLSFLVIAVTLLIAAFTYDVALQFPPVLIRNSCLRLQVSEQRLIRLARLFLFVGCLLMAYVAVGIGFMPLLSSNPGAARYLSPDLTDKYEQYAWLMNLALDFLASSTPLLLFSAVQFRRISDALLGVAGVCGVLFSLRRANLISVVIVLLLVIGFMRERFPRRYLAYLAVLIIGYFGSQLIFLGAVGDAADRQTAISASLSGLPEVRDLGWVMSLLGGRRLEGATFLSFVPLLGRVSDLKTQDSLVEITKRLIGMDAMGVTGGLRITLAGEGFLNFGALGCLIVGMVFGGLCSFLYHVKHALLKRRDLACCYLAASLFVWLCFWLYLAGTEATGVIRNGLFLSLAMFHLSRLAPGSGGMACDRPLEMVSR